jgi:hypothetical protein
MTGAPTGGFVTMLNDGGGDFQFGSFTESGGDIAWDLAAADFNGDGQPDLAVMPGGGIIPASGRIFMGQPNALFTLSTVILTGETAGPVVAADFDSDGKPDLAYWDTTGDDAGFVGIYMNRGPGFTVVQYCNVSSPDSAGGSMIVHDLDGDGILDLAIWNDPFTTTVLHGIGDGTFTTLATYTVNRNGGNLVVGDFNGDGAADLALSAGVIPSPGIAVLLNARDGRFELQPYALHLPPSTDMNAGLVAGDFDGDGRADLAATCELRDGGGAISVYLSRF